MKKYQNLPELLNAVGEADRFTPSEAVWRALSQRLQARLDAPRPAGVVSLPAASLRRRFILLTSVAAGLLLAFTIYAGWKLVSSYNIPSDTAAVISKVNGGVITSCETVLNRSDIIKFRQPIISSENTQAVLKMSCGLIQLSGESHLSFNDKTSLEITKGHLDLDIEIPQPDGFIVKTPSLTARAIGTKFSVKATSELTVLEVTEGVVACYNEAGSVTVTKGYQTIGRLNLAPLAPLPRAILSLSQIPTSALPATDPIIQIEPRPVAYQGRPTRLKIKITNTSEQLWFTPFTAETAYLLLNVTNPTGKVFYLRLNLIKDSIRTPAGLVEQNGWFTFPKDTFYEFECPLEGIFKEEGNYILRAVYSTVAASSSSPKHTVWQGLVQSIPVRLEVTHQK